MDSFWSLSFPLFTWRGVPVRCHWTVPLIAVFEMSRIIGHGGAPYWCAPIVVASFFLAILLHEGGHAAATRFVGGRSYSITLWALGGMTHGHIPMRPGAQAIVSAMGPVVNIGLWAGSLGILSVANLPPIATMLVGYFAQINLYLAILNAIPAHPLDGGKFVTSLLWGFFGLVKAIRISIPIGFIAVAGVFIYAIQGSSIFLGIFAVWLGFELYRAQQAFKGGHPVIFDLDLAEASRNNATWISGFQRRRAAAQAERQDRQESAEADILDRLLEKVTNDGLPSLSAGERRQLEQISKRQRSRE